MKYAKGIFLVLTVVVLAACGNAVVNDGSLSAATFGLMDLDGDGAADDSVAELPDVRARFYEVYSATVHRRPQIYPLASNMACRIDDNGECQPPVYKETVQVNITGIGTASSSGSAEPQLFQYPSSLSVEFDLEVEGSRRCLDQAIDAIAKNASLLIGGKGHILNYAAYTGVVEGSTGGTTEGSSGGTTESGTDPANPPTTDRPIIWGNYQNVLFYSLDACDAVEKIPLPEPLPIDPVEPQPRPLPATSAE